MKNIWKASTLFLAAAILAILVISAKPAEKVDKEFVTVRVYTALSTAMTGYINTMVITYSGGKIETVALPNLKGKNVEEIAQIVNTELKKLLDQGYQPLSIGAGGMPTGTFEVYMFER